MNILPNEIVNLNLAFSTRDKFEEILDSTWFIEYRNEKNRLKKKELIRKGIKIRTETEYMFYG